VPAHSGLGLDRCHGCLEDLAGVAIHGFQAGGLSGHLHGLLDSLTGWAAGAVPVVCVAKPPNDCRRIGNIFRPAARQHLLKDVGIYLK
jgi:hypothetical protein